VLDEQTRGALGRLGGRTGQYVHDLYHFAERATSEQPNTGLVARWTVPSPREATMALRPGLSPS